ncbi:hypothetical protein D3C78_1212730 [compost metagenome]
MDVVFIVVDILEVERQQLRSVVLRFRDGADHGCYAIFQRIVRQRRRRQCHTGSVELVDGIDVDIQLARDFLFDRVQRGGLQHLAVHQGRQRVDVIGFLARARQCVAALVAGNLGEQRRRLETLCIRCALGLVADDVAAVAKSPCRCRRAGIADARTLEVQANQCIGNAFGEGDGAGPRQVRALGRGGAGLSAAAGCECQRKDECQSEVAGKEVCCIAHG